MGRCTYEEHELGLAIVRRRFTFASLQFFDLARELIVVHLQTDEKIVELVFRPLRGVLLFPVPVVRIGR